MFMFLDYIPIVYYEKMLSQAYLLFWLCFTQIFAILNQNFLCPPVIFDFWSDF